MKNINVIPLIPSLNPDEKLVKYVNELIKVGFKKIIIVNDGSSSKYDSIFNKLEEKKECDVLKHAINQGKGRALKTGFHHYLNNYRDDYVGVVTADSDGQHHAKDTLNVANTLIEDSSKLVLGTRNFNGKDVPLRSSFGNKTTTLIFKLLYGKWINDTQTGLRGIGNSFIEDCLRFSGERFDYEINMLIGAVRNNVDILEVIIDTIYIEDNKSSHFNPIKDSIRIYKVILGEFFRFTFSGLFSSLVDILLFHLFVKTKLLNNATSMIFLATLCARVISSLVNYNLNKSVVFNCDNKSKNLIIKYYALCIVQMSLSALGVSLLFSTGLLSETICKIIVDLILFFISYNIQRKFIFKSREG